MEIGKSKINVHEYYRNKTVFLSGCTGFIGKVILEKLLWCFPDIKAIYLLIRGKKGQSINDRFYDNVIKSVCFSRLRQRHQQNFNKFIDEKCHLVEGDMTIDQLGISAELQEELANNIQIVINSAASIDFTADLDINIGINVFGGMRVFELAKKAKHLENFLHISTAYSNSNIKGEIEEKVYPISDDPLRLIQEIMSLPKEMILKQTKKYMGKFPNTYTYTKNLFEQILYKEKGKFPIVILRPTIVGALFETYIIINYEFRAYRDPMKGWTDAISASGALFLLGGLGLLSFVPGNQDLILDQIPVDFVVDYAIVASAIYAKNTQFNVLHCGTSFKNPFKFIWLNDEIWEYWKQNPTPKQVFAPRFSIITVPWIYKLKNLKRLGEYYSYIWFLKRFGNIEQKKQLTRFEKMVNREQKVCKEFEYFMTIDFIFKMYNCQYLQDRIAPQEKGDFLLDVQIIDWKEYIWNFCYGIQFFIMKEDILQPNNLSQRNALKQNPLKPRIMENYLTGEQFKSKPVAQITQEVLGKEQISSRLKMLSTSEYKRVEQMCKQMFADYNFDILKRFARPMQKQFKRVFSQIIVNESKINQLRVAEKNGKRLVIVSNHLSYADFVILTYIFYAYSLKCPFVNSSHDFLGIPMLTQIFRYGGAFFTERKRKQYSEMYSAILGEYMQTLIGEGANIEFFIETSRSRSGNLTPANNAAFDLFIEGAVNHPNADDILVVPLAVSYEKVIEQDAFTFELLGEEKPKEGILRLLKWAFTQISDCGRVYLQIAEPTPIRQLYPSLPPVHQPLMNSISSLSVIMPTSIVAAIILLSRNGISSSNLTAQADWLSHQLQKRQLKIASVSSSSPLISVNKAVSYFDDIMIKNKDIFTIAVKPKQEYKAILLLSYYRNALLNQLFKEAKAASSLFALNRQSSSITLADFNARIQFLDSLFETQFIDPFQANIIQKMLQFETISQEENTQIIQCKDLQIIAFLNSLLLPFIESYWCAFLSLQQLKKANQGKTKAQIIEQMQWLAEQLFDEKILAYYESCSLDSLKKAFKTFKAKNIIQKDKQTKLYTLIMEDEQYIEFEKQIRFYLLNQQNTSATPFEIAKLVLGEFPIVSKL